jgi:hypothetical protein
MFLIFKEIKKGSGAKSYMRKGSLIYEEMRKYLVIVWGCRYRHIWLWTWSLLNFLLYEENFLIFFYSASAWNHSTALQKQNTEISKQIFPENDYRGLSPNFHIHASVIDLYIPTIGLPILLEEICRPILGLYKLLTDTWMWKLGLRPRYSQKRNT